MRNEFKIETKIRPLHKYDEKSEYKSQNKGYLEFEEVREYEHKDFSVVPVKLVHFQEHSDLSS